MSSSKAPSFVTNTTDGTNTISNANNIVKRQTNNLIGTSTPIKQKQRDPLDKWINSSLEDGDVFLHRKADYIIGQIQSKSNSTITRPDFPFIDIKKALIKREFINLLNQDVIAPKRKNWKLVKNIMKDFKSFQQMLQNRIIIGLNNQVGPSVAGSSIINGLNTNVSASGSGAGAGTGAGTNTATSAGSGNNVGPSVAGNRMNNGLNTATSAGTGAGIGNNGLNTTASAGTGNNGNQLVGSGFVGTGAATSGAGNVGGADASINSGTESRTESDSDGASSSSSYYSDYSDYERRRAQRRRRERRKRRERRRERTRRGRTRRGRRRRGGRRRERSYGSRSRSRGYNRYRHR